MTIKRIDWTNRNLVEIETKRVRYCEDGLHYEKETESVIYDLVIPYDELLGISGL